MGGEQVRVGVAGCGGIGGVHGDLVRRHPRMVLVACTDVNVDQAGAFADKFSVPEVCASTAEMVQRAKLDLLIVATWPSTHAAVVQEACGVGASLRAILCEKSLAMTAEEVVAMERACAVAEVLLVEGFMYRHHPQIAKARELIADGAIGEVCDLHARFAFVPGPGDWRFNPDAGGGSFMDQGCYCVSALNLFAVAEPVEVSCRTVFDEATGLDFENMGVIRYVNCVTGTFTSSLRAGWQEELHVFGTEGTLVIPNLLLTVDVPRHVEIWRETANAGREVERHDFEPVNSYALQMENIAACLLDGAAPMVPIADSSWNLRTIDGLRESARSGEVVGL
jgi:predicted dehydrogenase